jgi:hypothetical protein
MAGWRVRRASAPAIVRGGGGGVVARAPDVLSAVTMR